MEEEHVFKVYVFYHGASGAGYCAIGYHKAREQRSEGTIYAWYTGVIKRKASREKKRLGKAHLSDNEMV